MKDKKPLNTFTVKRNLRKIYSPRLFLLVGCLFGLYFFFGTTHISFGSSKPIAPIDTDDSTIKYAANLLEEVHTKINANGKEVPLDMKIPFSWKQFLSLDKEIEAKKKFYAELNCVKLAGLIGKPTNTPFNCVEDPTDKEIPIVIKQNILLYLYPEFRTVMKTIHMSKTYSNPDSVVLLTKDSSYKLPVDPNPQKIKLKGASIESVVSLLQGLVAKNAKKSAEDLFPVDEAFQVLDPKYSQFPTKYIDDKQFDFEETLKLFPANSKIAQIHAATEKLGNDIPKYFTEAYTMDVPMASHMDWRFFDSNKALDFNVKSEILHRLMRAWLHFTTKIAHIDTWVSHGSLIGWYWNGLHLPYDSDIDMQISVGSLLKLIQGYNNTVVLDYTDADSGVYNSFYLDIGPYFGARGRGNRKNLIDARFIDINTGILIDITAVSSMLVTEAEKLKAKEEELSPFEKQELLKALAEGEQVIYDKNYHFYRLGQINPLLPTKLENEVAYIPNNFEVLLKSEYPDMDKSYVKGFKYRKNLRLWVGTDESTGCKVDNVIIDTALEDDQKCVESNKLVSKRFHATEEATKRHQLQLKELRAATDFKDYILTSKPNERRVLLY